MGWWDAKEAKNPPPNRVTEDEMQPLVLSNEQKGKMTQEKKLLVTLDVFMHILCIR